MAIAAGVTIALSKDAIGSTNAMKREPQTAGVGGFTVSVTPQSNLISIGAGPDGNMWFTESNNPTTGLSSYSAKVTTSGVVSQYTLESVKYNNGTYYIHPLYVASAGGYEWFTAGDFLGAVDTSGNLQVLYAQYTTGGAQIANLNWSGLTVDANGNLWFLGTTPYVAGSPYTNVLYEYIRSSGVLYASSFGSRTGLYIPGPQIYYMSDGGIWFANPGTNQIVRSDTNGNLAALTPQGPNTIPVGLGMGPDGNLYWSETSSTSNTSYLSEYNFTTGLATTIFTSSTKIGNTAGAASFLWYFTPGYMNEFNTSSHATKAFAISGSLSEGYITAGPDSNLYFVSGNSSVTKFVTH